MSGGVAGRMRGLLVMQAVFFYGQVPAISQDLCSLLVMQAAFERPATKRWSKWSILGL